MSQAIIEELGIAHLSVFEQIPLIAQYKARKMAEDYSSRRYGEIQELRELAHEADLILDRRRTKSSQEARMKAAGCGVLFDEDGEWVE